MKLFFSLDPSSAPGPGGFNGLFFQKSWDIVGTETVNFICNFLTTGHVPRNPNSNFIVLIPKIKNALLNESFRPIVLGNFLF